VIDVIVSGGGPAGLATALYAVRAGLAVTVRESRTGEIDKACGEGLMPGALTALLDLGVDPDGQALTGIRYVAGRRSAEALFTHGPGRGVRRTTLHGALRRAALDAGVTIEQAVVRDVRQDDRGVLVDGTRARYLVAADGLHSPLRRSLGLDAGPASLRRFGLRRHFVLAPWTSHVEVHWAESTEAYVTPVAPDLVGVALLTSARGSFDDHLSRFPALRARLAGTETGEAAGAGPLRQRATARVAGRVLLVGDAAGYVDALTGEGIALGVAQARVAVDAIASGDPARYEHDWRAVTRRYRLLTATLLGATQVRPLRRVLVPAARRMPGVFSTAVNALARPA
jgi:flavin-dependent dehydrogenase